MTKTKFNHLIEYIGISVLILILCLGIVRIYIYVPMASP